MTLTMSECMLDPTPSLFPRDLSRDSCLSLSSCVCVCARICFICFLRLDLTFPCVSSLPTTGLAFSPSVFPTSNGEKSSLPRFLLSASADKSLAILPIPQHRHGRVSCCGVLCKLFLGILFLLMIIALTLHFSLSPRDKQYWQKTIEKMLEPYIQPLKHDDL